MADTTEQAAVTPETPAAAAAQDPSAATTPAAPQPVAPAAAPPATPPAPSQEPQGPWANDLATAFPDEATRTQVDQFLRGTVQPHVTKTEQEAANARKLYDAFANDGDQAFLDVAAELYGDQEATQIATFLGLDAGESSTPQAPATTPQAQRDPEVQALLDERRERQEAEAFKSEFDKVNTDGVLDYDLFVPFVAKAGSFDQARKDYLAHQAALREAAGVTTPTPETPTPPPVVGGEAQGAAVPPTEEKYETVNDAIDAFAAEERARAGQITPPAPPVAA